MRKIFSIFIMVIFTSCGGGSSQEAKELLSKILTVVGIPQDIIVNICQDSNGDGVCSSLELSSVSSIKQNLLFKIILGENNSYELKNYDPNKKIIMELQDSKNIELNGGNFSLEFNGTSTELSILQSIVDSNNLNRDDTKGIDNLDEKETFYEILLSSLEKNLNQYLKQDIDVRSARDIDLKELGRVFKDEIPLKYLATRVKTQCNQDRECIRDTIKSLRVNLETDEQNISILAQSVRRVPLVNDRLMKEFTCQPKEQKIIKHYGFEDIFSLKNRDEKSKPSLNIIREIGLENLVYYDIAKRDKFFADTIRRLPKKFRKGVIYIGLKKSRGELNSGAKIHIGEYKKSNPERLFSANLTDLKKLGWSNQAINSSDPTTDIYYSEFKNIQFNNNNTTLLDYLKEANQFDVVVGKNTPVDFISVATCSLKNPEAEIKEALNIFSCPKDTKHIKVAGGSVDAFGDAKDRDATPSDVLLSAIDRPTIGYDELANNKFFLETLNRPNFTVTKGEFSVGIKPIAKYLYQNDTIHIGSYELDNYARYRLYGKDDDSVYSVWTRMVPISNGEMVLQTDISDINLSTGDDRSLLSMFNSTTVPLDILIQNDTSVDFTYLNLCVKED